MLRQACLQISTKICMAGASEHTKDRDKTVITGHIWLSCPSQMIARFVGCHCHHFILNPHPQICTFVLYSSTMENVNKMGIILIITKIG